MKLVLSSRPTSACSAAFESCRTLRLQDLTPNNIRIYATANLAGDRRLKEMAGVNGLIHEIVEMSSGVYMCVVLVVKILRSGFRNHDSIEDLRGRLGELPIELDGLYRKMLDQIDTFYKQQASMLLQIMYQSTKIPSANPMTALRLSFAFDNPEANITRRVPMAAWSGCLPQTAPNHIVLDIGDCAVLSRVWNLSWISWTCLSTVEQAQIFLSTKVCLLANRSTAV